MPSAIRKMPAARPPRPARCASRSSPPRAMPIEVPLRGRTKAKSKVTVVAQTTGVVQTVAVTKGQTRQGRRHCSARSIRAPASSPSRRRRPASTRRRRPIDTNLKALREEGRLAPANTALAARSRAQGRAGAARECDSSNCGRTEHQDRSRRRRSATRWPTVGTMLACRPALRHRGRTRPDAVHRLGPRGPHRPTPSSACRPRSRPSPATTVEGKVTYISSTADRATRSFPSRNRAAQRRRQAARRHHRRGGGQCRHRAGACPAAVGARRWTTTACSASARSKPATRSPSIP